MAIELQDVTDVTELHEVLETAVEAHEELDEGAARYINFYKLGRGL